MTGVVRRVVGSDIFRHGSLVLVAMTLGNLASFGYHAVVSRHLGVAEYGALYALISFASLVTLPVNFLPTVVARYAAEFRSLSDDRHVRALARFVVRMFGATAIVVIVLLCLLSVPIAGFLRVPAWCIPPTAVVAGISLFAPMIRSVLQGEGDFAGFSLASALDGFAKCLCGALAVMSGLGIVGGLLGFAMGGAVSSTFSGTRLWRRFGAVEAVEFKIDWRRVMQTSGGAAATTIAVAILTSSDVIFVKHFFDATEAGLYAAASLGGKIMLFGVGFAPTILLPKATQRHTRGEQSRGALLGAGLMLAGVSACGLLVFWLGGPLILRSLVGAQFMSATPLLVWYALAMTFLAGTSLLTSYALALHRFTFAVPLVLAALAEPAGIIVFHRSLESVIGVIVAANVLAFLVTFGSLFIDSLRARRAGGLRADDHSAPTVA